MTFDTPWETVAKEICETLATGLDVAGTVESADIFTRVGATCLEIVIETSDVEGADQADVYRTLCDLLETRLNAGRADQVFGCLLLATEPDAEALGVGLTHMVRTDGVFVPVLPLGRDQAFAIADAATELADFADDATALIGLAADQPSLDRAETLLDELDELISRRTGI